jgi:diguanylate cyclase (GGDEF)-like protein/PAS domain S-box-containing protein
MTLLASIGSVARAAADHHNVDGFPTVAPAAAPARPAMAAAQGGLSGGGAISRLVGAAAEVGSPQLGLVLDTAGEPVVAWANHLVLELLGLARDAVVGAPLHGVGDEAIAASGIAGSDDWRLVTAKLMAGHEPDSPAAVYRPDASRVPVQVEVIDVTGAGWVAALRWTQDATEAAREAEHRFLALAEHAPIGIVMSEAGARLSYVNRRFEQLAGRAHTSLLGTGWLNVIHPADVSAIDDAILQVLSGSPVENTVRIQPDSAGPRWITLRLAPVTTPHRAAGFIGTAEDVTARRAWEDQLAYQARHDALTGLANRRRLVEDLTHWLDDRRGAAREFALMFCDLDGFKQINDNYGHEAGDRALIEVATRLIGTAGDRDLVARIAGDEFVVILGKVDDIAAVEKTADRFLAALKKPLRVDGKDVRLSASLGLALPEADSTPESLLRAADHAMYLAKASSPGSYRLAVTSQPTAFPRSSR